MAKLKSTFFCRNCGANSPKWIGNCPSCGEWNTYIEEKVTVSNKTVATSKRKYSTNNKPENLRSISISGDIRVSLQDQELGRALGGGLVPGSVVLVGGQPGIGKSTLMLQLALNSSLRILYVSGEESKSQIKGRAKRLGQKNQECFIHTETNVEKIIDAALELEPEIIIIDSIQTLYSQLIDSTPGSIVQIRETTGELMRFAKERNTPIFIIGHITKDGSIAGPKLLEHMVDTVLQFEGDRNYTYRILRTLKNRFGSTDEIGIYEMKNDGLREVSNPSDILLSHSDETLSGSAVAATLEGIRPMLIETQALVSPAVYGNPQRSTTGFDIRRLHMLLAVLEKRCGMAYGQNDVFLNIAGGIKINDPAIDLAILASLISSLEDIPINKLACFAGEVGLSGEIRAVNKIEQRAQEADRLGFEQIYISKYNLKGLNIARLNIEVIGIAKITELLESLFG